MSAIGPQFYEFLKKLDENNGKLPTSVTSRAFQPEFEFNNSTCYLCNGYYGPSFGEPVCVTCHEFLYPDIPHHLPNSYVLSEKTDDGDSGNDEPSVGELLYNDRRLTRALQQQGVPNWAFRFQNSLDSEASPEDPVEAANVRGDWMYGSSRSSAGGSRAPERNNEGPREGPSGSHSAVSGSHEAGPSVDLGDRSSIGPRDCAASNEGQGEGGTASGGPREGPITHHEGEHQQVPCSIPKEASCSKESPSRLPKEGFSGNNEASGSSRDSVAGPSACPKEGPSYGLSEGASFRPRAGSNSIASGPREGAVVSNSGPVLNRVPGYSYYGNLVQGLDQVKDRPNKPSNDTDDPGDVFYGAVRVRRRRDPNEPDDSSDESPIEDRPVRGPGHFYSAGGSLLNRRYVYDNGMGPAVPDDGVIRPLPSSLARSIAALSTPRPADNLAPGLVESLPSEVVLCVFSYLDDLSLSACARVCVRWARLVRARVPPPRWAACALRRWPLFNPLVAIHDWHKKYQALVESCFCRNCVVQMCMQSQPPFEENAWRRNRLRNEIKMLRNTPPEGCAALPLDPKCCHWQAMVTGPVGSPYEGGVFYLYIQVPYSYPMSPPVVRFLTRILHPNVSRHGDVGIDSVHHNWSLALTISKLLISIQSLLTDPYTAVCMEPEVGEMYVNERARFERIARRWTWRYAMHDMYSI